MIYLGLHGWRGTHDAAAAIVIDGTLVACVEEERLVREKHAPSRAPKSAISGALHTAGITLEDVDAIAYGWDFPRYLASGDHHGLLTNTTQFLRSELEIDTPRNIPLEWLNHHRAHAASAFFSSGLTEAAILVVDGQGEDKSISLFVGDNHEIRLIRYMRHR